MDASSDDPRDVRFNLGSTIDLARNSGPISVVIAETSTKNNSKKASMMDAPAVDPHAARFVFESIILARESVPCPVVLAAGWVDIARFGRYKAKKSLVISITASS